MASKLTRLVHIEAVLGPTPLRTQEIIGEYSHAPTIGQRFQFFAVSLTEGSNTRLISTSEVSTISVRDGATTFTTESGSAYTLEVCK